MPEFFDDMWLTLEKDLSSFDNFIDDRDWMNAGASDSSQMTENQMTPDSMNPQPNIEPQTYENLLMNSISPQRVENPYGKSLQERIQAIKEIYNQIPTIINAREFARLHKTAGQLYKKGKVKEGNRVIKASEEQIHESFVITETNDDVSKTLEYAKNNGEIQAIVTKENINDKERNSTMRTYDNFYQALKDYLQD